eukprot:GEMP01034010.1.p1 GENE.GEMP01034010.1~~GEMP01034010.1.p1  ORF type:complete len:331 (+),score=45.20 GEMP01034010.1:129-1121(+)
MTNYSANFIPACSERHKPAYPLPVLFNINKTLNMFASDSESEEHTCDMTICQLVAREQTQRLAAVQAIFYGSDDPPRLAAPAFQHLTSFPVSTLPDLTPNYPTPTAASQPIPQSPPYPSPPDAADPIPLSQPFSDCLGISPPCAPIPPAILLPALQQGSDHSEAEEDNFVVESREELKAEGKRIIAAGEAEIPLAKRSRVVQIPAAPDSPEIECPSDFEEDAGKSADPLPLRASPEALSDIVLQDANEQILRSTSADTASSRPAISPEDIPTFEPKLSKPEPFVDITNEGKLLNVIVPGISSPNLVPVLLDDLHRVDPLEPGDENVPLKP